MELPKSPVRLVVPALAVCLILGSLLSSGLVSQGPSKDIDSRYFYVAAKLWASGHSPYVLEDYTAAFTKEFAETPGTGFPYLPAAALFMLPMAPFAWPLAATVFSVMNVLAALALSGLCWLLLRRALGTPLKPLHWVYLVVGSTLGGIGGTLFTGQTSVFITLACVAAVVGVQYRLPWLTVLGLVVATAKPQLAFPVILFLALFQPREWKALVTAGVVTAVLFAAAALLDGDLVGHFRQSLNSYSSADVNNAATGFGFSGFLGQWGLLPPWSSLVGFGLCGAVLLRAGWIVVTTKTAPVDHPGVLALLFLAVGLALPIHIYDDSVYALAVVLVATLRPVPQALLLAPALLVWRPNLIPDLLSKVLPSLWGGPAPDAVGDGLFVLGWIGLAAVLMVLAPTMKRTAP